MTQLALTAPYQPHSPTSKAAAKSIEGSLGELQRAVLAIFRLAGPGGLTDEQAIAATNLGANTVRPRRIELVAKGLLVSAGQRRATTSGRMAQVWRAKP